VGSDWEVEEGKGMTLVMALALARERVHVGGDLKVSFGRIQLFVESTKATRDASIRVIIIGGRV
jgi:hypothetical protein